MLSLKKFKAFEINHLNKFSGGVKDTTWRSGATNIKYKDYKFKDNEANTTSWGGGNGGTDKTFETP